MKNVRLEGCECGGGCDYNGPVFFCVDSWNLWWRTIILVLEISVEEYSPSRCPWEELHSMFQCIYYYSCLVQSMICSEIILLTCCMISLIVDFCFLLLSCGGEGAVVLRPEVSPGC